MYVSDESIADNFLFLKQLADLPPWEQLAFLMWKKRNSEGPYRQYLEAEVLLAIRENGELAPVQHLLGSPFLPSKHIAAHLETMFPPHTAKSPFYKIRFVARLDARCRLDRPCDSSIAARVIHGFENESAEPFRAMVAKGWWPRDVSKYLLQAFADDGDTAYQFEVFSSKRGRRWPLARYNEMRDIHINARYEMWRATGEKEEFALHEIQELTGLKRSTISGAITRRRKASRIK